MLPCQRTGFRQRRTGGAKSGISRRVNSEKIPRANVLKGVDNGI
nr:MAG TPA: hypothetical protein [Caudoviricetes sp.]